MLHTAITIQDCLDLLDVLIGLDNDVASAITPRISFVIVAHVPPQLTFLLVSPPGALVSRRGIASLSPRTRSGGVLGLVLKKFMVPAIGEVLCERKKR